MSDHFDLTLSVNDDGYTVSVPPDTFLSTLLREHLGILDVQEACTEGECGSCTVFVDGIAIDSCIFLAAQCHGREVTTVSGLEPGGELTALQRSFARSGAVQCGFCTPGFVMSATSLLRDNPTPTDEEIREGLAGNLCRCTGYNGIIDAVREVAANTEDQP